MSQVNNLNPPSTIAPGELFSTGTSSVQLLFAQLQISLAQANKEKALEKMEVIQKNQALARETADMIAQARELQNKGGSQEMTDEMKKFFEDQGLKYYDKYPDREKNEAKIKELEEKIQNNPGQKFIYELELKTLKSSHEKKLEGCLKFDKDQWDYNIKSLTNFQEQIGADTQQLMVFIQDFMGQYNAYLSGANNAIRESNQTLAGLTRNQ